MTDQTSSQPTGLPAGGFRLDGLNAVVTGASRNIGASIATAVAESGADLVVVARDADRLQRFARSLNDRFPERRVIPIAADMGDRASVDRLVAAIETEVGLIDVIVNNAAAVGTTTGVPILEVPDAAWDEVYEANLLGPFRLIRALVAPLLAAGRSGSVINVLSGAGFLPVPTQAAYGATKAALWMVTRSLALELAPAIRVNALVPGVVSESGAPRNRAQADVVASAVPFGRVGRPEEVAGAAVYLASPAASYTSGTVIFCNGARAW
jgi:NAD(P)-dependent dehydrogenase (short-subunit alcohol dehydrogenase family)